MRNLPLALSDSDSDSDGQQRHCHTGCPGQTIQSLAAGHRNLDCFSQKCGKNLEELEDLNEMKFRIILEEI
jgi:hypothetical protein